jgi:hypothetical protein
VLVSVSVSKTSFFPESNRDKTQNTTFCPKQVQTRRNRRLVPVRQPRRAAFSDKPRLPITSRPFRLGSSSSRNSPLLEVSSHSTHDLIFEGGGIPEQIA